MTGMVAGEQALYRQACADYAGLETRRITVAMSGQDGYVLLGVLQQFLLDPQVDESVRNRLRNIMVDLQLDVNTTPALQILGDQNWKVVEQMRDAARSARAAAVKASSDDVQLHRVVSTLTNVAIDLLSVVMELPGQEGLVEESADAINESVDLIEVLGERLETAGAWEEVAD